MKINIGKRGNMKARIVLYGPPGAGKTTFLSQAPKVVIAPTEDGCSNIEGVNFFDKMLKWEQVIESVDFIGKNDTGFLTYALDTIDGAAGLCKEYVKHKFFSGSEDKFNSYGKGWEATIPEFKVLLDRLDRLREVKNTEIILVAHQGLQVVNNPVIGDHTKYTGQMNKKLWEMVMNWADIVGYISQDFIVIENDGDTKIKKKSENRYIIFSGGGAIDCKSRVGYEMPERCLLSYEAFDKARKGKE